jgi:hypothetical protein
MMMTTSRVCLRGAVRLDLTKVPEERRNEALLSLGGNLDKSATLDLTIGAHAVPALRELVRQIQGSLKVSARDWGPVNVLHVVSGLDANRGLKHLELDWEGCGYTGEGFRALMEAMGRHRDMESFELCLYQDEQEADIVLDERVGEAVGDLLQNGTLKELRFVNWFGYVMSSGFVRAMSEGLASSSSVVSFGLRNCALPRASYGFLTLALRDNDSMLTSITVGIDSATVGEVHDLFDTLKCLATLRSIRISPCHLPREEDAASMLELAVRENASLHYVGGLSPAFRKARRRRLDMLLEANRFVSQHRTVLDAPDRVSPPPWPIMLARLARECNTARRPDDPVVHRHYVHHLSKVVRQLVPWLLVQSHGSAAGRP